MANGNNARQKPLQASTKSLVVLDEADLEYVQGGFAPILVAGAVLLLGGCGGISRPPTHLREAIRQPDRIPGSGGRADGGVP